MLGGPIEKNREGGRAKTLTPIKTSTNGPNISHLFFADDLVLMSKVDKENCETIKSVLETFCDSYGYTINTKKNINLSFQKTLQMM